MNLFKLILICTAIIIFYSCSRKIVEIPISEIAGPEKSQLNATDSLYVKSDKIPIDDRVKIGSLSNGMKYYIQKNQRPENRAELRLAVNAGSILEDEDQLGLAHFIEHMAFNGTKNFEKSELVDYLESVGSRFGPDLNAYTSFDETVYMLQVRTDSMDLFNKGIQILRDWAVDVSFDGEEIDKERGVVVSEWRSSLSPEQRMQQKYFPLMFYGSKYAERLPIGDPVIIETANYETIRKFYKDWYRPELMSVVIVGDIELESTESMIKNVFSNIPGSENSRIREKYKVPSHNENLYCIVTDKEAPFTTIRLIYKHEREEMNTLKDYRKSLLHSLYNTMLNSRLRELTKKADPPFLFAFSGYGSSVGNLATYSSFANVPEDKILVGFESILTENQRVLRYGFTDTELEREKTNLLEQAKRAKREMDKTESGRLAMKYVYNYLDNSPIPSPSQRYDLIEGYLPDIQLSEINELAANWITDQNTVTIVTGPEKESIIMPTEDELKAVSKRVSSSQIEAYEDEVLSAPFFSEKLTESAILEQNYIEAVDAHFIKLNNGLKVYLKATDYKNDEVVMRGSSYGGTSLYPDEEYFNAQNATGIVVESGLSQFSNTQLEKLMTGKNVSVTPFISSLSEGFNGRSSPEDLETMFQLIYLYFTAPREDIEAYKSYITKQKNIYKNLMSNPQYYFFQHSSNLKYNNHPRMGWPKNEDWLSLDQAKAYSIYRERFSDASDFTFYFVGNIDINSITSLCQKYLGNLPSKGMDENWEDLGIEIVEGEINDSFAMGLAPRTRVEMFFHGNMEWSINNSYIFSSMIEYLRIKLRESLREDKGGVYGVNIFGNASRIPRERYSITLSFNSDPDRTEELIGAAKEVIRLGLEEGPDEKDMTKVKESQRQSKVKNLKQNRYWLRQLKSKHDFNKDFESILMPFLEEKLNGLSAEKIRLAAKSYFNYENYIQIIMEPEEKKAE